jgi:hypothetical protein
MLVTFANVIVADSNADNTSNFGEFTIIDANLFNGATESNSKMRVETDDGATTYGSATSADKSVLSRGTQIKTITGIMYFSFGNYKLVPRNNSDVILGSVSVEESQDFNTEIIPHPAQPLSRIYATLSTTTSPIFQIMNIHGQKVYSSEAIKDSNDRFYGIIPAGLPSGMYMFTMSGASDIASGTFIVQ